MIIFLLAVFIALVVANYSPDSYLSVWDSLHTEFNIGLDIKRNFFAVWQEYRGLGLLDGMVHAADLPRQIFLLPFSFILPQETIRYFFLFLMLIVGVFGVYILLSKLILKEKEKSIKESSSIIAALFYLLNFGTVQYFYVPFEAFSIFWAMFPWLIYTLLLFLNFPTKKHLFFFILVNIVAIPSFYIQTLFIVYFLCLFLICASFFISKRTINSAWIIVRLITVVLFINAYWLLPSTHFFRHKVQIPQEGHGNFMSTENTYLQNRKRGTLEDLLLLRGYYYDFVEDNNYMLSAWREHFDKKTVVLAGLSLAGFAIVGLLRFTRFQKYLFPILGLSILALLSGTFPVSFFHDVFRRYFPLWDQVFRSPFTKFIVPFSFSFTVFLGMGISIIMTFLGKLPFSPKKASILCGFGLGILIIYYSFPSFRGYYFSPSGRIKIPPEYFKLFSYFEKQNSSERIAIFPQYTYWGWGGYIWGYRGSGFIWQGIKQPVLDRAFDVWSGNNENFYWEITYAFYSQNYPLFEKILDKYKIKWVIIDGNIVSFGSNKALQLDKIYQFFSSSSRLILEKSFGNLQVYRVNRETEEKDFVFLSSNLPVIGSGYRWNNYDKAYEEYGDYISIQQKTSLLTNSLDSEIKSPKLDNSINYQINNDRFSSGELTPDAFYPFRSLFTGRKQEELEFQVKDEGDYFSFKSVIPKELAGGILSMPSLTKEEVTEIDENDLSKSIEKYPQVFLDGELVQRESSDSAEIVLPYIKEGKFEVRVPKIKGYYSYEIESRIKNQELRSCDQFNKGIYTHDWIKENDETILRLTSIGSSNCLDFDLSKLPQRVSYLVTIESRNLEGNSLLYAVINKNSQRTDLETYLPKNQLSSINNQKPMISYFVLPPMEEYGQGYTLHFDNISIGRVKTVNDLGRITVNPIPYRFLTGLKVIKQLNNETMKQSKTTTEGLTVSHPNPSLYHISFPINKTQEPNTYLVLSQSFDKGWKAYEIGIKNKESRIMEFLINLFPFWFGKELKDHMMVNNWENGWQIGDPSLATSRFQKDNLTTKDQESTTMIVIVYLPQYLEYLGFILLFGIPLIFFLVPRSTSTGKMIG